GDPKMLIVVFSNPGITLLTKPSGGKMAYFPGFTTARLVNMSFGYPMIILSFIQHVLDSDIFSGCFEIIVPLSPRMDSTTFSNEQMMDMPVFPAKASAASTFGPMLP